MSNIEQIDFSTLTWVKTELDETLNRAKEALKAYVEDTEDTNQLQFCVTYLHQIQGTLKMVELYGAAMVAEEMEWVAKDLIEGSITDVDAAYDVLMQSILQLPDYLERIELGHKDVPIVLLPLVNDLRAVRSEKLLSESALFNPNLDLGVPERVLENDVSLKGKQLNTALLKIRSIYQTALLNWIKNDDNKGLNNMQLVISKLQMILSPQYLKQLFWTYSGLVEGLLDNSIEDNFSIKQIGGKVDHLIKELIDGSSHTSSSSRVLTRNMLYYIAISKSSGRIGKEIQSFFNLSQFIPDQDEIKQAEGSLSGKNKELLQTVSDAINDDVLVVQESLDLFIRNKSAQAEELKPSLDNLQKIGDTLGILGLGVARDSVIAHNKELHGLITENKRPTDAQLLDVAKTLLMIESQLTDHIQALGVTDDLVQGDENSIPKSEQKAILQTLAKESIINLQQIKTNFVAFIESPWDKEQVKDNPRLLNDIAGAMKILNLAEAGNHVDEIIGYVNTDILGSDSKPSAIQLEQLATVISSLEYYLENLDQGERIRKSLLSEVGEQIKALRHQASQDTQLNEEITVTEPVNSSDTEPETHVNTDEDTLDSITDTVVAEEDGQEEIDEPVEKEADTAEVPTETLVVDFSGDVDDEIKEVFLEEFEEELANMQERHTEWKQDPEANEDKLTEIRRIFHTLKGSGRLVGAEAIGEFGWMMESMCNRLIDGAISNSSDFRKVLDSGVVMSADLFKALQNKATVPAGYDLQLLNADNVANGKDLVEESIPEVVQETAASSSEENEVEEVQPEEVQPEELLTEEVMEVVDAQVADSDPLNEDIEMDFELDIDSEEEPDFNLDKDVDLEASIETIEEVDEPVPLLDENAVEEMSDEANEEADDGTLDFVQYDIEDIKAEQTESTAEIDTVTDEKVTDEMILEVSEDEMVLEFDMDEIEFDAPDEVSEELIAEDVAEVESDNKAEGIDLDEDEINDLESELASFDGDEEFLFDSKDDTDKDVTLDVVEDEAFSVEENEADDIQVATDEVETAVEEIESDEEVTLDVVEDEAFSVEEYEVDDIQVATDEVEAAVEETSSDEEMTLNLTEDESFNFEDFSVEENEVNDTQFETEDATAVETETDILLNLADSEQADSDGSVDQVDPEAVSSDNELDLNVDPVFIEILQKEVGAHLTEMSQFVSDSLEKDQPKVNDNFVRVVHTLNGAASMASVDGITQMTTPLEKMSIMLMDREEILTADDLNHIETVIKQAKSQLNLLGTGTQSTDDTTGDYFVERIAKLDAAAVESKNAEDLVVENTLEVNQLDADSEEVSVDINSKQVDADEYQPEAELGQESDDQAKDVEDTTEEDVIIEEDAPEPFQQMADDKETEASTAASELELDEELLEIFSEEASEIFDRADHMLAELEDKPNSPSIIQALQRDLHTLKGGARMAGLNQIGDLSHQFESLFESIAETNHEVAPEQHEMMSQIMHRLHGLVNSDDYGLSASIDKETKQLEDMLSSEGAELKEKSKLDEEFFDPLAQVDAPLADLEDSSEPDQDKDEQTQAPKKKANVLSGGQIKVNSELLDKLVNFAGEVSIYRSRMEQQSAELKLNIDELENTVERVRRQLRELEHETEAQIISNYQMEGNELEEDFDPLELDQFSTIQQLSRSLSESVSDLTNIQSYLQESARSSETLLIQQSRVNTELQEGLMETRLVTFNSLVPRLRRVLRTAGQELKKTAKLTVNGAEGEMDKTVLEGIQAPLEHMIRNAMVHGIEKNRKKVKKSEQGQIEIELSREATEVVITVKDDGAGIDTKVLKKKAIERGIIEKDDELSDHDIAQLITHSGLSAANKVSKLAGRGVGMDVVNNEIKRLGGSIEIISLKGEGTTFVIRLPYTLALTQAIIVQIADHRYAIPASGVQGLIRMNIDEFRRRILEGDLGYDYAGEQYQVQELNKLLSVDSEAMVEGNQVPLVMIKSGDQGVALRVDQTYGGREVVVKSVGTQVASVPGIFGATILGDGAVVLILDIIPMHRAYIQKLEKLEADGVELVEEVEEDRMTTIMVVDDSITMRRAGERMLARNDFEVMTAKDGLDALNKLQEQKPDLMLLDIEMPRMDGFELATNMKASERFKDIPIIMITSRTGQKHKDRAKEIGVERYLGKPYQEIDLLENINDLLQLEDA